MVYTNKLVMCVLVNGAPQKELADGTVPLPFDTEYALRFRNRNSRRAVVRIYIDGEEVSGNGYVVPANGFIDIERHFANPTKFRFVDLESPEAIEFGKNGPNDDRSKGVIEARFFMERERPPEPVIIREDHHHYYPPIRPWKRPYRPYDPYYPDPIWTANSTGVVRGATTGINMSLSSANLSAKAHSGVQDMLCFEENSLRPSGPLEDGCTVEGGYSSQQFGSTYVDLEDTYTSLKLVLRGSQSGVATCSQSDGPLADLVSQKKQLEAEIKRRKAGQQKQADKLRSEIARLQEELAQLSA